MWKASEVIAVVNSYIGWIAFTPKNLVLLVEVNTIRIIIMSIDQ